MIDSYLSKHIPRSPATAEEMAEMCRKAWVERGVLVVRPDQIGDDWQRVTIESIGNELYGRRDKRK